MATDPSSDLSHELIELEIGPVAHGGHCVARHEGRVVFVPQYVVGHWWENVLHNQSALRLRARLQFQPGVMITTVPWQLESSFGREELDGGRGPAPGDLRRGLTTDQPTGTPNA